MITRSSASSNLFVYGTLTDKHLVYQLTGKKFPTSSASLRDFERRIARSGYPYILPHSSSKVEGLLIRNLDPESLRRLDRYEDEGRLYFRKTIAVFSRGRQVACETYVGNRRLLEPGG